MGLPSLSSVEKNSNSQFLPASAPSVRAATLAAPFQPTTTSQALIVAASDSGRLTAADDAAVARIEAAVARVPHVLSVEDQGGSVDRRARQAMVELDLPASSTSPEATRTVAAVRKAITSTTAPPGLACLLYTSPSPRDRTRS